MAAREPPLDSHEDLNALDRARVEALLAELIAAMRAAGRDPQAQQALLGALFAERLDDLAAQGVAWAERVRRLNAARVDLGIEAILRRLGIEPE